MQMVIYAAVMAVVVFADQLTKWLASTYLKEIGSLPLIQDVFHLTYVENTGAAFGILKNARWVFIVISAAAIVAVIAFMAYQTHRRVRIPVLAGISLSLIAGGGIGNMIDRLMLGYVIDFFDFTLINFAVFNVADSCVTVGVVLMVIYIIFGWKNGEKAGL